MLKTRVLTAVVLVPLVLLALFGLDTRSWGILTLVIVGVAASEWARLAGFRGIASTLFVVATAVLGLTLLFAPGANSMKSGPCC